MIIKPVK